FLDARLGDRGDLVLGGGLEERLAHELDGDLRVDARTVDLLEHGARRLALAKPLERDLAAEIAVGLAELGAHDLPRDLHDHLLLDRGDVFDAHLHGGRWLPQSYCWRQSRGTALSQSS